MTSFHLFAYRYADGDGTHDLHRRGLPAWRLDRAVAWALEHGSDGVLIERTTDKPSLSHLTIHHVCRDAACPGGCE